MQDMIVGIQSCAMGTGRSSLYKALRLFAAALIKMATKSDDISDDIVEVQSNNLIVPSRKRVSDFLSECLEAKQRKRDIEPAIVKKKAELSRVKDQIGKMKQQMLEIAKKLQAKEAVADALEDDFNRLNWEWNSAVD